MTVGEPGDVAVGDPGRTFLERRVDQTRSVVASPARVETVPDEVMDRPLDSAHVHPPRESEIGIEEIAVPVLFGRPSAQPTGPWGGFGAA